MHLRCSFHSLATLLTICGCVLARPDAASQYYDPAITQALGSTKAPPLNDTAFTCKVLSIALGFGNSTVTASNNATYLDLEDEN